jgi:hypothetical protein
MCTENAKDSEFILSKQDIFTVFRRYGQCDIIMRNEVSAFVVFTNSIDAYFALKHINNFKLE